MDDGTREEHVRWEGLRDVTGSILHYDFDAIISVGYRVHAPRGVHFRRWATSILREKILGQNAARLGRMDQTTELLAEARVWDYGTQMQSKLAARLGYTYKMTTDANRQVGDGRWVKDLHED